MVSERHRRIAGPFSAFILTIIGAGLASRKIKGGQVSPGISLAQFSYILFMRFQLFSPSAEIPPAVPFDSNLSYGLLRFRVPVGCR